LVRVGVLYGSRLGAGHRRDGLAARDGVARATGQANLAPTALRDSAALGSVQPNFPRAPNFASANNWLDPASKRIQHVQLLAKAQRDVMPSPRCFSGKNVGNIWVLGLAIFHDLKTMLRRVGLQCPPLCKS
jgi:hypothetical protein